MGLPRALSLAALAAPVVVTAATTNKLVYSAGFTSDMVLQRETKSAVYGLVTTTSSSTPVITVSITDSSTGATESVVADTAVEMGGGSMGMCDDMCVESSHFCRGGMSCCGQPSCAQGCVMAHHSTDEAACKAMCDDAMGNCEYTVSLWTFESCGSCPDQGSSCGGVEECYEGCSNTFEQASKTTFAWKALLSPRTAGGDYTVHVAGTTEDGDIITPPSDLERVTFGDLWYCAGQSNMALTTHYSFEEPNVTRAIVEDGKYANIRLMQYGDMDLKYESEAPAYVTTTGGPWFAWDEEESPLGARHEAGYWRNLTYAASWPEAKLSNEEKMRRRNSPHGHLRDLEDDVELNLFHSFAATCFYFAKSLTDEFSAHDQTAPPIGLIATAVGGSQIEAWMPEDSLNECSGTSLNTDGVAPPTKLYNGMVAPFVNMSIKGFLWYQGENNCGGDMGDSVNDIGYACEVPAMLRGWRSAWSSTPNTTSTLAPFGTVSLAAGGSEGHGYNMSLMRWAQTANYGVLPNPAMPNTFMAHAYDLADPWLFNDATAGNNCSVVDERTGAYGPDCADWAPELWNDDLQYITPNVRADTTDVYMGGIHPRLKGPVGHRLAAAAMALVYDGSGIVTGPTLSGCTVASDMGSIEVLFNTTLLAGDSILVQAWDANASNFGTDQADSAGMMVCLGSSDGHLATSQANCADTDQGTSLWQVVPVSPSTSKPDAAVSVDLSGISYENDSDDAVLDTVVALRYGWPMSDSGDGYGCCPFEANTNGLAACIPGSCPLMAAGSLVPANPWYAHLVTDSKRGGLKCECKAPQVCDAW
eukprot:CAMPEP_0182557330 /NCGR_PEP_ID=MMETSP1324-20130603/1268_1 /TAXON_ID=236786 /ORGANISM="Florenciella sp., Strain RCC1587" /LENGTH=813 /DNA_ID=CAMNT_0024769361 /DNA_START=135 /DNA_END=2573 /DNA_ORIENTATION=-